MRIITVDELEAACAHAEGPYIFGGKQPISTQTVNQLFDRKVALAGVKRIRLHNLRHSQASILLNDPTISVAAVSACLGHSNVATTMKVYTRVIDKATKSLNDKIAKMAKI